jgi:hypothetical protein
MFASATYFPHLSVLAVLGAKVDYTHLSGRGSTSFGTKEFGNVRLLHLCPPAYFQKRNERVAHGSA